MTDYTKYVQAYSKPQQDDSVDLRPRINWYEALGDVVDHLEAHPKSEQRLIATGIYLSLSQFQPWLCDRFIERLRASPTSADTADAVLESLRFMQYNDNRRDR